MTAELDNELADLRDELRQADAECHLHRQCGRYGMVRKAEWRIEELEIQIEDILDEMAR